jgi:hypothetical protein
MEMKQAQQLMGLVLAMQLVDLELAHQLVELELELSQQLTELD